jgi:hypothetical protein
MIIVAGLLAVVYPQVGSAQSYGTNSASSYSSLTPMDRPVAHEEGRGVRLGEMVLHAGMSLEGGYDSNLFYEDESEGVSTTAIVRLVPSVRLETPDPRDVRVGANLQFVWEFYLSDEEAVTNQSGAVDILGDLGVQIGPRGLVSFTFYDVLRVLNDSSTTAGFEQRSHLYNEVGGVLGFHPSGADRTSRLGFTGSLSGGLGVEIWDEELNLDRQLLLAALDLKYHFLPKTAFFISGNVEQITYDTRERPYEEWEEPFGIASSFHGALLNIDSLSFRVSGGIGGLLTRVINFRLQGGVGIGDYDEGESFMGPVLAATLGAYFTTWAHLSIGWNRGFSDSNFSNYVESDRFTGKLEVDAGDFLLGIQGEYEIQSFAPVANPPRAIVGGSVTDLFSQEERVDPIVSASATLSYNADDWLRFSTYYRLRANLTEFIVTTGVESGPGRDTSSASQYIKHEVFFSTEFEY